jgi:hypothetical protein
MHNASAWRIHKWQLAHVQLAKVVHWIRFFFFPVFTGDTFCFASFIHHFLRLYLFSILSKSFFEFFYWLFSPPLMSIFVWMVSFFSCFRVWWPWPTWWDAADWLFYLPCCSRFWMSNPFFYFSTEFPSLPFVCRPHTHRYTSSAVRIAVLYHIKVDLPKRVSQ